MAGRVAMAMGSARKLPTRKTRISFRMLGCSRCTPVTRGGASDGKATELAAKFKDLRVSTEVYSSNR